VRLTLTRTAAVHSPPSRISWRTERARTARVEVESLRDRYPRECGALRLFDARICPVSDRERGEGFQR